MCVPAAAAEGNSSYSVSGSETSSVQEDQEEQTLPPINNSDLCIQESSSSKKLPSLTNEGAFSLHNH